MSEEDWHSICHMQWKCTSSHVCLEFGWNSLLRFFITPKQKALCTGAAYGRQCGALEANHWHIFWDCPVIKTFWTELHKTLGDLEQKSPHKTLVTTRPTYCIGVDQHSKLYLSDGKDQIFPPTPERYIWKMMVQVG